MGDGVQIPGILVVVRVTGRDGRYLGPQSFFEGLVVGFCAQNVLVLGGVGGGPDRAHPARKEHRAGCDETKDHQNQQYQHSAHQNHVGVGRGKLRRFSRGGLGLLGGGAAGTVGRAAARLATSLAGVIAGLDLLTLLPAGDGVGCGLFGLFLPMQRLDVGLIGGFVQLFGLLVGFQFLAVLAVLQLFGHALGQAFPLVGGLHADVFILVLLVDLAVSLAAQQRLRARLAALGFGDLLTEFRLAEAELGASLFGLVGVHLEAPFGRGAGGKFRLGFVGPVGGAGRLFGCAADVRVCQLLLGEGQTCGFAFHPASPVPSENFVVMIL